MIVNPTKTMKQGEAIRLDFKLTEPDSRDPLDLTNVASLEWGLYLEGSLNTNLIVYKTTDDDIDITNIKGGLCSVYLYTDDTDSLDPGKYKYELWQTDNSVEADQNPLAEGSITIKQTSIRNRGS
jgi:hypothetical protein